MDYLDASLVSSLFGRWFLLLARPDVPTQLSHLFLRELDPPRVRITMPLSCLEVKSQLIFHVRRVAQLLVDLRQGPMNVGVVRGVAGQSRVLGSNRRKRQLRLECGHGILKRRISVSVACSCISHAEISFSDESVHVEPV